jgi:methionyl-tRNA synthetase
MAIILKSANVSKFNPNVESLIFEALSGRLEYNSAIKKQLSPIERIIIFSHLYAVKKDLKGDLATWFIAAESEFKNIIEKLPSQCFKPVTSTVNERVKVQIKKAVSAIPGQKNILITSALPYVNNVPHLGNIIGCVLSADVYARYCRLKGYNTLYICGTDEYGTATETKALEEKISCQALCDKYHKLHKEIYEWFNVSFDFFGRTTTEHQTTIAQDIFNKLNANNYLMEDSVSQLYCNQCKRYLADRYVEGTCPLCKYTDARGDQCDGCGKLLNATELINPRCKLDGNAPVTKSSSHMFLKLNELQKECEDFVKNSSTNGKWPTNGLAITNAWLKEGLKPRCITRDLKWGTPVPLPSMKEKVFYVWFDAPIGYLSITANFTSDWESWWKNPDNVKLYQFMGKDNIPFHTVIFPCSLIGTKEKYTLLHHVSTTEYLNYEGGKFSKSRNVGVFGNNVKDSGIPVSVWRYYLLSNRPEANDSVFMWDDFVAKTNSELLANLGNFASRAVKFVSVKFNGVLPGVVIQDAERDLIKKVNAELAHYNEFLENVKLKAGLKSAMAISSLGNLYLTEVKLDNALFLNNPERCGSVMNVAINLLYLLSALFYPYIPDTSEDILKQLNAPLRTIPNEFELDILPGHKIGKPQHLFKRIEEAQANELRRKYSGGSAASQ